MCQFYPRPPHLEVSHRAATQPSRPIRGVSHWFGVRGYLRDRRRDLGHCRTAPRWRCTAPMTAARPLDSHALRPHVAVIGGGISGLATAYFLRRGNEGPAPHVTVIEAADRLGGKVLTCRVGEFSVDTGPDSLPGRPVLLSLLEDLGFADAIVPVAPLGFYVWSHAKLRRLPPATMFGVPDRLIPLLRSRLLSPSGALRAGLDLVLPRQRLPDDPSVAELLRPRFGTQLFERLVEPLLGGMHAGRATELSARSTVPSIDALVRANRSPYLALRRMRRKATNGVGPTTVTLDLGLGQLIAALTSALTETDVRLGTRATALQRSTEGFQIDIDDGSERATVKADAVVVATPAFVTADLVESLTSTAATELRDVPYVGVATIILTYPADAVGRRLDATGFLVPPVEGRLVVGCSWLSAKWPHLSAKMVVVVRAMVGRAGDQRWAVLDDATLIRRVHAELAEAMSLSAGPLQTHVQRWPRALPQYTVGHQDRLNRLDVALAKVPGLHVTGAAYRGAGVAGCVAQAEEAAARARAGLAVSRQAQMSHS